MFSRTWRSFILVAGETALLVAAVVISSIVIGGRHGLLLVTDNTAIPRVLLIVVVCQLSLHYVDLYDLRTIEGPGDLVRRLMRGHRRDVADPRRRLLAVPPARGGAGRIPAQRGARHRDGDGLAVDV